MAIYTNADKNIATERGNKNTKKQKKQETIIGVTTGKQQHLKDNSNRAKPGFLSELTSKDNKLNGRTS